MKNTKMGLSLIGLTFLSGCSNLGTEDTQYVGFSEARYYDTKANSFKDRFWSSSNDKCLTTGDQFDIRLQSLKIDQEFEGLLEKITSDSGNELGVFLTINKTKRNNESALAKTGVSPPVETGTLASPVERRLVYMTDSRLKNVDINSANLLIYSDLYDNSDYKITLEVVEFDSENIKKYASIAKEMIKAAQESGISYNLPFSALLTNMGTALFNHIARDDKIISYETQLLSCNSIADGDNSVYFERGDLAIIRVSQQAEAIDWTKITFDPKTKRSPKKSNVILSIIKRI
ncbi:hypothetical protein [Pseudomonas sp. CFBP 5748]